MAPSKLKKMPWWAPNLILACFCSLVLVRVFIKGPTDLTKLPCKQWYLFGAILHIPYGFILLFLICGFVELFGFYFCGRSEAANGRLPSSLPLVCVQLPMFNEQAVAERAIEAACALDWPPHLLEVQVLDDSTDPDTRALVEEICGRMLAKGHNCQLMRRTHRSGYKAGALEVGRRKTKAELIAILDADFLPAQNYLHRAVPYFYDESGNFIRNLALVQSQWGHLNSDESYLTASQSLWVDSHHSVQMAWRSAKWKFVNFTGTAGIWRADAIERAGGWRSTSLVEDCELSFRHLFAGFDTRFVKEIVVPAELPDTYTAYKAQQKRWTQGWVQLQRLHLRTLLKSYKTGFFRKLHLIYHICISWQWALWGIWLLIQPYAVYNAMWIGEIGLIQGTAVYAAPSFIYLFFFSLVASLETCHTYNTKHTIRIAIRRMYRMIPYALLNTAMLPHQFMSFSEGLFGAMNAEFERTPKTASVSGDKRATSRPTRVKVHIPYVAAEVFFFLYNVAWTFLFLKDEKYLTALCSSTMAISVAAIFWFYGDHAERRLFLIPYCHSKMKREDSMFDDIPLISTAEHMIV